MGTTWTPDPVSIGVLSNNSGTIEQSRRGRNIFDIGEWWVKHLWPLRIVNSLGERIRDARWVCRVPFALIGGLLGFGLLQEGSSLLGSWSDSWKEIMQQLAGNSAGGLALCVGAILGWLLPTVIGGLLMVAALLIGLGIGLAIISVVLGLIYCVIAWVEAWPPFDKQLPNSVSSN